MSILDQYLMLFLQKWHELGIVFQGNKSEKTWSFLVFFFFLSPGEVYYRN